MRERIQRDKNGTYASHQDSVPLDNIEIPIIEKRLARRLALHSENRMLS